VKKPNKILSLSASCCLILFAASVSASNALVEYVAKTNKLSVYAEKQPLQNVLTLVALKTGLEILFDASIDKNITTTINNMPLEKAVRQIVRKTNHVFYYKTNPKTKKQLLVGLKVFPAGKHDESSLTPLVTKKGDFYLMRKTQSDLKNTSENNFAYVRRMVRYKNLDPEQRENINRELDKVEKQIAKNKSESEKRYQALRAQSKTGQAERLAREEKVKQDNPVFYERMKERRREIEADIIGRNGQ